MLLDPDLKKNPASQINVTWFLQKIAAELFLYKKNLQYILKSFLASFPKYCPNVFENPQLSTIQDDTLNFHNQTQTLVVTFRCGRGAHTPRVTTSEAAEFNGEDLWLLTWPTSNDNTHFDIFWPSLAPLRGI